MNLLIPVALLVFWVFFSVYAYTENINAVVRLTCFFFGFLCFTVGMGWLYMNTPSPQLKIVDWIFIGFNLSMLPLFELFGLIPYFYWLLFFAPSLLLRYTINWIVTNKPKRVWHKR